MYLETEIMFSVLETWGGQNYSLKLFFHLLDKIMFSVLESVPNWNFKSSSLEQNWASFWSWKVCS